MDGRDRTPPPACSGGSRIQETNRIAKESALLLESITDYAIFMLDANGYSTMHKLSGSVD
jgi:hypothetical protein